MGGLTVFQDGEQGSAATAAGHSYRRSWTSSTCC
jgi:hypothetical protein